MLGTSKSGMQVTTSDGLVPQRVFPRIFILRHVPGISFHVKVVAFNSEKLKAIYFTFVVVTTPMVGPETETLLKVVGAVNVIQVTELSGYNKPHRKRKVVGVTPHSIGPSIEIDVNLIPIFIQLAGLPPVGT
jgi:hypothetical protein